MMIAVYVPCARVERRDLWFRLLAVMSALEIPCCLGGNFNEVKSSAERRGCVGDWGVCWSSSILYMMGGFVDLLAVRKVFTWYDSGSKGSRLDLFLVSAEWLDHFEGARLGGFLAFATLSCVTKPLEVRRHVKAAFEAHFSQPQVTNTFEPILLHGSLSGEYRDRLEQPFTFRGVEYGSK
ncbi:hypothetical protein V6N13_025233 [Hibiscus sabdariffa]